MTMEMIQQAQKAHAPAELLKLAQENDLKMTIEEAKAYFDQLHAPKGELSDDELDDVSGGTTCYYHNDYPVTTVADVCDLWTCPNCGLRVRNPKALNIHPCSKGGNYTVCCNECKYCSYEDALWLCKHPEKKKSNH